MISTVFDDLAPINMIVSCYVLLMISSIVYVMSSVVFGYFTDIYETDTAYPTIISYIFLVIQSVCHLRMSLSYKSLPIQHKLISQGEWIDPPLGLVQSELMTVIVSCYCAFFLSKLVFLLCMNTSWV